MTEEHNETLLSREALSLSQQPTIPNTKTPDKDTGIDSQSSDESSFEILEIHETEPTIIGNVNIDASDDELEILEIDQPTHFNAADEGNNFIDIDEEEDILEYGSPHTNNVPRTIDNSLQSTGSLSIPIILQTGNFPYLLAPLTHAESKKLPKEYEDVIILFDDGIALGITMYEVFEKIRSTFEELENPFKETDDLVINFKEFDLSLAESSIHAHQLILSDVMDVFNKVVENTLDDPPSCLHLELSTERSFIDKINKLRGIPNETVITADSIFENLDSEPEDVVIEPTKTSSFRLSKEERTELDHSLTPEDLEAADILSPDENIGENQINTRETENEEDTESLNPEVEQIVAQNKEKDEDGDDEKDQPKEKSGSESIHVSEDRDHNEELLEFDKEPDSELEKDILESIETGPFKRALEGEDEDSSEDTKRLKETASH